MGVLGIGLPISRRIDVFAVYAGMHGDGIARMGEVGGSLDRAQGRGLGAGTGITAGNGDVELGG